MGRTNFDFQRLEVFELALQSVVAVDDIVHHLPTGRAYVRDQLRRAANGVALNIAEGAGEYAATEKARFYRMAKRSATECAGQILVCRRLGVVTDERADRALALLARTIALLVALVRGTAERGVRGLGDGSG